VLIPIIGAMVLLAHPGLPLWPYLVCAALSGMGGGNFAASASNANAFSRTDSKARRWAWPVDLAISEFR